MSKETLSLDILGKTYHVSCPADEVESLKEAAALLQEKMQQVKNSGKVIGFDRIAVIAGLNLAHEIVQTKHNSQQTIEMVEQGLLGLTERVESLLEKNLKMELLPSE